MKKQITILGIRGIPAQHGGFETFAERLALFLVARGWHVRVYCQEEGSGAKYRTSWNGVELIHIPVRGSGALSTVKFDFYSIVDSLKYPAVYLTLGYNTAIFNVLHWIARRKNIINMDGIEWKRKKWGRLAKLWFWLNERIARLIGDVLIADHPDIELHLKDAFTKNKLVMIPYGADSISSSDSSILSKFGVEKYKYYVVIARPEPENSILEVVSQFSNGDRGAKLVVLGEFSRDNPYHAEVLRCASDDVIFPGAIYDAEVVNALRFYCYAYVHGHQVGGTNPSLVEALGAGAPVVAHGNKFNMWVASNAATYFHTSSDLDNIFSEECFAETRDYRSQLSRKQHSERFEWEDILKSYEECIIGLLSKK